MALLQIVTLVYSQFTVVVLVGFEVRLEDRLDLCAMTQNDAKPICGPSSLILALSLDIYSAPPSFRPMVASPATPVRASVRLVKSADRTERASR